VKTRLSVIGAAVCAAVLWSPGPRAESLQGQSQQQSSRQAAESKASDSQRSRLPFWKDPAVVKEVGLTPEQAKQIDKLWHDRWKEMTGRAEELRKQEIELERMIAARTVNPDVVALQIDRVEAQRTMLYKSRTLMLYRMALVLTPEQNKGMKTIWDRLFGFSSGNGRSDSRGR
jgi:hypothetical protein